MRTVLGLLIALNVIWAAQIDEYASKMGFERDYKTALAKAKKEKKPLMLIIVGDYCPWCHKFERQTLNSKAIKPRLDDEMISVIVDKKYDKNSFPEAFVAPVIPVVYFINANDGKKLHEKFGYTKKKEFAKHLDIAKQKYKGAS